MLWRDRLLPVVAVITAVATAVAMNFTVTKAKTKADIEVASIKMSKIETSLFVTNKINDHLVNQQVVSFSSAPVLSDATQSVVKNRLKIEISTRRPVQDNVSR